MSETKLSQLDKRISQFCDSSRELLTDIHSRKKSGTRSAANRERRVLPAISIPDPDIDLIDEGSFGL